MLIKIKKNWWNIIQILYISLEMVVMPGSYCTLPQSSKSPKSSTSPVRLYSDNLRPKNRQPVSQLPTRDEQII